MGMQRTYSNLILTALGQIESDIGSLESSLKLEITLTEFQEAFRIFNVYNTALTSNLLKIQKKEFPARRCPRQYE
jgi:hypothetical protein